MTRKFKPLSPESIPELPSACAGCTFWESPEVLDRRCGASCDPEALAGWIKYVRAQWGDCGLVVKQDDDVLGFIKYAKAPYFPQASHFPSGRPDDDAVLISCMHIAEEARNHGLGKVMLQAVLRDLLQRGERTVQAYGYARQVPWEEMPVVGVDFLQRMGFKMRTPHPEYPLMRLDLRSLAAWTENLEAVLESLRLPLRARTGRVATPFVKAQGKGAS